ncbi:MAG: hypothetical protein A3F17_00080 [Gammaproteobacteria bacterium RIFCSPHIGHO2_12_FULL_41_15]|nr:MAG: hypothetical protein A3F17_00080 [Gammaproteobacteria bacterium RIFCSPHIGHO2_12_FULL_41_15]
MQSKFVIARSIKYCLDGGNLLLRPHLIVVAATQGIQKQIATLIKKFFSIPARAHVFQNEIRQ